MSDKYRFTINYMIGDADGHHSESVIVSKDNVFLEMISKAIKKLQTIGGRLSVKFDSENISFNKRKGFISEFEAGLLEILFNDNWVTLHDLFEKQGYNKEDYDSLENDLAEFSDIWCSEGEYFHYYYVDHKIESLLQETQNSIYNLRQLQNVGELSDGTHTFNELYDFRMIYNALLFNRWARPDGTYSWNSNGYSYEKALYDVHKSWKHNDGQYCFGSDKEWFIVSAMLPTGLISNHYPAKYWYLFEIPTKEKALFPYDGHTSQDVLNRLKGLI